jgi:hypothetical protein
LRSLTPQQEQVHALLIAAGLSTGQDAIADLPPNKIPQNNGAIDWGNNRFILLDSGRYNENYLAIRIPSGKEDEFFEDIRNILGELCIVFDPPTFDTFIKQNVKNRENVYYELTEDPDTKDPKFVGNIKTDSKITNFTVTVPAGNEHFEKNLSRIFPFRGFVEKDVLRFSNNLTNDERVAYRFKIGEDGYVDFI